MTKKINDIEAKGIKENPVNMEKRAGHKYTVKQKL